MRPITFAIVWARLVFASCSIVGVDIAAAPVEDCAGEDCDEQSALLEVGLLQTGLTQQVAGIKTDDKEKGRKKSKKKVASVNNVIVNNAGNATHDGEYQYYLTNAEGYDWWRLFDSTGATVCQLRFKTDSWGWIIICDDQVQYYTGSTCDDTDPTTCTFFVRNEDASPAPELSYCDCLSGACYVQDTTVKCYVEDAVDIDGDIAADAGDCRRLCVSYYSVTSPVSYYFSTIAAPRRNCYCWAKANCLHDRTTSGYYTAVDAPNSCL